MLPRTGPWHAVRFSTWNELWEPLRIPGTPIYKSEAWGTPNLEYNDEIAAFPSVSGAP